MLGFFVCFYGLPFSGCFLFLLKVIRHFDGCKADLVVCDGAPDGKAVVIVLFTVQFLPHTSEITQFHNLVGSYRFA